jgi:hypothetical protein
MQSVIDLRLANTFKLKTVLYRAHLNHPATEQKLRISQMSF